MFVKIFWGLGWYLPPKMIFFYPFQIFRNTGILGSYYQLFKPQGFLRHRWTSTSTLSLECNSIGSQQKTDGDPSRVLNPDFVSPEKSYKELLILSFSAASLSSQVWKIYLCAYSSELLSIPGACCTILVDLKCFWVN